MTDTKRLTFLMSREAKRHFRSGVESVLGGAKHRIIELEALLDQDCAYPIDAAFLTRDITGDSSKMALSKSLERFHQVLNMASGLRWLQIHAAGADRPIYAEYLRRGVIVTTGSGANSIPVAQMAITGLLALARRLPELLDAQKQKIWEPRLGEKAPEDLHSQTVMIVGMGPIGQEVARLCNSLRMRVIGVRRSRTEVAGVAEIITYEDLSSMLPHTDWVVLTCPLTEMTRGLLNAKRLSLLRRGAHVINVSRGEVVVESALIDALRTGQVGGAYLDVFEREPLEIDSFLWTCPNVIITPHTAGHTSGHYDAVGRIFLDNLARWHHKEMLRNVLNRGATHVPLNDVP